jgi:hypothetical protein
VRTSEASRTVILLEDLELLELRLGEHGAQLLQRLGFHLLVVRAHLLRRRRGTGSLRLLEQLLHLRALLLQDGLHLGLLTIVEVEEYREAIHSLRLTSRSSLRVRCLCHRHSHCAQQDGCEETRFHNR